MTALKETVKMMANATFRVEASKVLFEKMDRGKDVYYAQIFIAGRYFGFVSQRRGGAYQAYFKNGRLLGEAGTLSELREKVCEAYAESNADSSSPTAA